MSQNDVCTTRQAARRLGVSLRTVQLWVENGTLPAWKTVGGHRRISTEAVDRLVAQQGEALDRVGGTGLLRVLVVEDQMSLRQLYQMTLASWDLPLEVLTAENGYQGLLMTGEQHPDLLIADLSMPYMDGFEMIRTLKAAEEFADLEIVVVSALDKFEIEARGGLPEGVTVFPKPIPFADLKRLVQSKLHDSFVARS